MKRYVNTSNATVQFPGMPAVGTLISDTDIATLDALVGSVLKKYSDAQVGQTPTTVATVAALSVNISADSVSADGIHTLTVTALNAAVGQNVTLAGTTPAGLAGSYKVLAAPDANTIKISSPVAVWTSGGTAAIKAIRADQLAAGIVVRTGPGAGYADTMDTAAQILEAISNPYVGMTFMVVFQNAVAFANTIAASTGVTFVGSNVIAASAVVEFMLVVTGIGASAAITLSRIQAGTA